MIAVAVTAAYMSDLAGGHQLLRRERITNTQLGMVSSNSAYQGLATRAARLRIRIDLIKNPSRHPLIAVNPAGSSSTASPGRPRTGRLG